MSRLLSGESTKPQSGRFNDSRELAPINSAAALASTLAMFPHVPRDPISPLVMSMMANEIRLPVQERYAARAPFHIVGVSAKEENVDWHKKPWYL